jgi:K(+)-stimulated pyrophosphate-energized sodium pump
LPVLRFSWRRSGARAAVVQEVRRQFREKSGIMDYTEKPGYGTCVDLVTKAAQREMILSALIPIVFTVIVGLISIGALCRLLTAQHILGKTIK